MKFKKYISRILSCYLFLSMYASCMVNGEEHNEQKEAENLENIKIMLDDAERKALVPYDAKLVPFGKNQKQDEQIECYICKENPISYFMPSYTSNPVSKEDLKDSNIVRCTDCGKLSHDICAVRWIQAYTEIYGSKICPCPSCKMYCIRLKEKQEKLLDYKLKKYENKAKDNFDLIKFLKDPKNKWIAISGGLGAAYLLFRKPVVINVNYEKK